MYITLIALVLASVVVFALIWRICRQIPGQSRQSSKVRVTSLLCESCQKSVAVPPESKSADQPLPAQHTPITEGQRIETLLASLKVAAAGSRESCAELWQIQIVSIPDNAHHWLYIYAYILDREDQSLKGKIFTLKIDLDFKLFPVTIEGVPRLEGHQYEWEQQDMFLSELEKIMENFHASKNRMYVL